MKILSVMKLFLKSKQWNESAIKLIAIMAKLPQLQLMLPHLSYSSDLNTRDYDRLANLQRVLQGQKFGWNDVFWREIGACFEGFIVKNAFKY